MPKAPLESYRRKRDFSRTAEPVGGATGADGNRFVVHKHHATSDHYDLRLQVGDVLKSWAVPKGPSLDPAEKRLAVETEDHPLEYADFEGVIPAGQYGGGPMIVWDAGVWAPMDDPEKSLASGAFKFRLAGEKLKGGWMLARLKPRPGETQRAWLLFKERDPAADARIDILAARPESVKTGRRIEDLVAPVPPRKPVLRPGTLPGAVRAPIPDRIEPQLATATAEAPDGGDWLHEIKFDGYRTLARKAGGEVRLLTRGGLDWTRRYGDLAEAFAALPCREAVIDGEIVVLDAKGVSRFAALQAALSRGAARELVFFAFDLLHLNGWDISAAPLIRRKALLANLLAGGTSRSAIHISDHVAGGGPAFFERVSEMGLEGVVSKPGSAPYQPGRSRTWTKTKALRVGDFVVAGYTTSEAAGGLAALALAEWQDGELAWRGKVGSGFDAATLGALLRRLEPLREGAAPIEGAPKDIHWVRPVLTAHVHYATRTAGNALRHAVFKGLREVAFGPSEAAPVRRLISDADLASVTITNPKRRLFGRSGATKLDVAVYYAAVGDVMLPHLLGRPVSLVRCPTGRPEDCFFQRHAFTGMPASVATFPSRNSEGETRTYLAIEDARGYLALAQFGVVEFHTWGALRRRLEKPDRVVFDLDPGEGVPWREIVEAAVHIRGELVAMGLVPFVKTSGGKGLHVVVPIRPGRGWKQVHAATRDIAERLAATAPASFTTTMGPANRKGRIFIDFHRNARGATAVAPWSLRARPTLPVSAPLRWDDLEAVDAPEDLNYSSLPALVLTSGDPWADIDDFARNLPG
jgi:DNA ligase D